MDKAAMVSVDIGRGSELLNALERAKVKVSVALWGGCQSTRIGG